MKKVAFLGAKEIGYHCLKLLHQRSGELGVEIVAVLTNARGGALKEYCLEQSLPMLASLDDYLALPQVDITLSVQYHEILKHCHISKARELAVNLHMAPLPEYRGCNQFSYAIIDGRREFGVTLHQMDPGIDSGAIIAELRFPIPENCWVQELHGLAFEKSLELFRLEIANIVSGRYTLTPQEALIPLRGSALHYRKEIEALKRIDLNWPQERILRTLRATYMPGFEPPWFELDGERVYLVRQSELKPS